MSSRLEYEKNQNVDSPINELETTLGNLNTALERVKNEQKELQSATDKENAEIEKLKRQVQGMLKVLVCFVFLFVYSSI